MRPRSMARLGSSINATFARLRGRCGRGGGIGFPLFPGAFAEKGFGVLEGYGGGWLRCAGGGGRVGGSEAILVGDEGVDFGSQHPPRSAWLDEFRLKGGWAMSL